MQLFYIYKGEYIAAFDEHTFMNKGVNHIYECGYGNSRIYKSCAEFTNVAMVNSCPYKWFFLV